jgi:Domain of unknown function (DUF5666)
MIARFLFAIAVGLALTAASAQDAPTTPPDTLPGTPPAGHPPAPSQGPGAGGWQGQHLRAGSGGPWAGTGMGGRGVIGVVAGVAADHYLVKTEAGETYAIHFSVNTRIMKQAVGQREHGERGQGGPARQGGEGGSNPQQALKPTDIKVGDSVAALGEVDLAAKSVGAVVVLQIDPERALQMREMQENYGKTWLMGKVTAIDGVKVTIMGGMDNAAHVIVADENTTFRKRREPITLADIQVGDTLRVEGAVKDGSFLATTISAMGTQAPPPTVPRDAPPTPK